MFSSIRLSVRSTIRVQFSDPLTKLPHQHYSVWCNWPITVQQKINWSAFSQLMGFQVGGPWSPGPNMSVSGANIGITSTWASLWGEFWKMVEVYDFPDPIAHSSSSCNFEGSDSMKTWMANNLSLNDFQPQIFTNHSPPTSFSFGPQTKFNQLIKRVPRTHPLVTWATTINLRCSTWLSLQSVPETRCEWAGYS